MAIKFPPRVQVLHEGVDDLRNVEGLEWQPHVHA
jgi:hypothetical protein